MDALGFLRVMQPSIMAGLLVLGVIVVLYVVVKIVVSWTDLTQDGKTLFMLWTRRVVGLGMLLIFLVLLINAVILASTDRMPRSDADKAKSGVYRQMQKLEKSGQ